MSTTSNGSLPDVAADQSGVVAQVPATRPDVISPLVLTPAPGRPGQADLAEEDRRRRAEHRFKLLVVRAEYLMKVRVRHPDGGECPADEIIEAEKAQRLRIEDQTANGSMKHRRLPRWLRWVPMFVLCFDFCLLLYFFAGITNVYWPRPLSMALAFAVILAAMVTVLSYGLYAFTGHRLRGHKNHAGTVHAEDLDGFTRAACVVAGAVIVVIAVLMYLRMRTEVVDALGAQAVLTAEVIAVAIATVSAAANFLVIAVQALDGSDEVTRLDRLSAAARRPYARAHKVKEQAARHAGPEA